MELKKSKRVSIPNNLKPYDKWLASYTSTGAFTGCLTVYTIWRIALLSRPRGVTWSTWGLICGNLTLNGVSISAALGKINKG